MKGAGKCVANCRCATCNARGCGFPHWANRLSLASHPLPQQQSAHKCPAENSKRGEAAGDGLALALAPLVVIVAAAIGGSIEIARRAVARVIDETDAWNAATTTAAMHTTAVATMVPTMIAGATVAVTAGTEALSATTDGAATVAAAAAAAVLCDMSATVATAADAAA